MSLPTPIRSVPGVYADCVQHFAGFTHDTVKLVAFDWEGERRFELTCSRRDADDAHLALLALTRLRYPSRTPQPIALVLD